MTICDMSLTYITNKSSPKIDPWDKPQNTDAGYEKLFPKLSKMNGWINKI